MLNRRVNVPLQPDEIKGLLTLSQREDRDPRRQAARLVREGLERAGILNDQTNETSGSPADKVPA